MIIPRIMPTYFTLIIFGVLALPSSVLAKANPPASVTPTNKNKNEVEAGPYCGLYCVYASLIALDRPVEIENVIDQKYLTSNAGSSLKDLQNSLTDFGTKTLVVKNCTLDTLRASTEPVILHVRNSENGLEFDHWMLYLGTESGHAIVIDPPGRSQMLPFSTILSRWDGVALFVSRTEFSHLDILSKMLLSVQPFYYYGLIFVCLVIYTAKFKRKPKMPKNDLILMLSLITASAFTFHAVNPLGFLLNQSTIHALTSRHATSFMRSYDIHQLQDLIRSDHSLVLIDARYNVDFTSGHIPQAINITFNERTDVKLQKLAHIPKNAKIVVYCQSTGCQFDEALATFLASHAFSDVSLFPGGWVDWQAQLSRQSHQGSSSGVDPQ